MDGEGVIMPVIVELLTNAYQAVMFISFLYLFFDKPEGKLIRLIPFMAASCVFFAVNCFFTFSGIYETSQQMYIDSVLVILIMLIYALGFLRGKWYLRMIMPLVAFALNALISYTFGYFVSFATGHPMEDGFAASEIYRYFCIIVVNLTTTLFFWLVIRMSPKRLQLGSAYEMISFVLLPILCIVIIYCLFFIYHVGNYNSALLPYIFCICIAMVFFAVLVWIMLLQISRANAMKTEFKLMSQREKLYEEGAITTNAQIGKISRIKHDMKNKMLTMEKLLSNGEIKKASELCEVSYKQLEETYTPVNTSNPVLNAILNVELEKASEMGIQLLLDINDYMEGISSSDIISVVGNLCDNALEYIGESSIEPKKVYLYIRAYLNYIIVTCKNKITESVIATNPLLETTKSDKEFHGKGLDILRKIAKSYFGEVKIQEENDTMVISVVLSRKS